MKSGNSDGSAIYPSLHNRYTAYVYTKYCNFNSWNFPRRTFGFNTGKLFLFTFNGMLFKTKSRAKFCRSVGSLLWCLFIRPPSNLPDMTDGPTVFREVDRSVKQIKFHLKSYLILDRKTGINSNNLPNRR